MTITIHMPVDIERELRKEFGNLDRAATELLLIHAYRQGKLNRPQLAEALGLDSHETSTLLQRHRVEEGTLTMEDLDEQQRTLSRILGEADR